MPIVPLRPEHWPAVRAVGTREKIGKLNGRWRDALLLERRSRVVGKE